MNLQVSLENDWVLLEPLSENDFEALYKVAKDPLIWEQHPNLDRYQRDVFTAFFREAIQSKGAFLIFDKKTSKVIGSSRFNKVVDTKNAIEIGWSFLSREKWGGDYNRSIKELMMDYAFQFVDFIVFYIDKDNIRSQKAVQKLGAIRITENHWQDLIKESETDWTYLITKEKRNECKRTL